MRISAFVFIILIAFIHAQGQDNNPKEFSVNGLKVIYKKVPKQIVSVNFVIKGGTANYEKQEEGIEALALQWAVEGGTMNFPKNKLFENLESTGTEISYYPDYDFSTIEMNSLEENWLDSWQIFTDILFNPIFDIKQFNLFKKQLISDAKFNNQDPETKLRYLAMSNVFKGFDYEKVPEGSAESLSKLSSNRVRGYYKSILNKENCFLTIVGNLDEEELRKLLTKTLQELPTGEKILSKERFEIKKGDHKIHHRKTETNHLRGYMNAPRLDSNEGIVMWLSMNILNERIIDVVRRREGLSYHPRAFYATGIIDNPYNFLYVSTSKPNLAIKFMVEVIDDVRQNGFEEKELSAQKATFLTDYYLGQQTTSSQSQEIVLNELRAGWQNIQTTPENIASISLENVNQTIRKYTDTIRWTYLGNEDIISYTDFIEPKEIEKKN